MLAGTTVQTIEEDTELDGFCIVDNPRTVHNRTRRRRQKITAG
jgi:hypothetical protein